MRAGKTSIWGKDLGILRAWDINVSRTVCSFHNMHAACIRDELIELVCFNVLFYEEYGFDVGRYTSGKNFKLKSKYSLIN